MRILFITQVLPYPPNAGPRVKTWHVLQYLANKGAQITLLTFLREEEKKYLPIVENLCEKVIAIPIERKRVNDLFQGLRSLFNGRPFLVQRDNFPLMQTVVRNEIDGSTFNLIHADQLSMAQYALQAKKWSQMKQPAEKPPFLLFDAHNATWTIMDRMKSHVPALLRPFIDLEKAKIQHYEDYLLKNFDHTLAVSTIDKKNLLSLQKENSSLAEKISVIPIAIDTQVNCPVEVPQDANQILTIGTLHYPPNADGIRWFLKEVYPLVLNECKDATLTIIGKNPPMDFYNLAANHPEKVNITGYVDDLLPYMKKAAVLVVPVLAGGGMRVRILEGFSRQMAVVTTTVGLEGIEAENGKEVLIQDNSKAMAESICYLLKNPKKRESIAIAGRKLVEERYDWQIVFSSLGQVYKKAEISMASN